MKRILVPVDFSTNSETALRYAASLAADLQASITLFNAYTFVANPSINAPTAEYLEDYAQNMEKILRDKLQTLANKYLNVKINVLVKGGGGAAEIIHLANHKSKPYDLVVMGAVGAGEFAKWLFGSTTTEVMRQINCPLLAIPAQIEYKPIKQLLFASMLVKQDLRVLENMLTLTRPLGAWITCLHVGQVGGANPILQEMQQLYRSEAVGYSFLNGDSFHEQLDNYIKERPAEMLAMVTQERSAFERIFDKSKTEKILFQTEIPLLIYRAKSE